MFQYSDTYINSTTQTPIEGAEVYVYPYGSETPAIIKNDAGVEITQPLVTNGDGLVEFWLDVAQYVDITLWVGARPIWRNNRVAVGEPSESALDAATLGRDVSAYQTAAAAAANIAESGKSLYFDGSALKAGQKTSGSMVELAGTWIAADKVGSNRGTASSVPASVKSLMEAHVSAREWGVEGTSTGTDHAKMQKAFDECPLGATLHIPNGIFFTTGLNLNRQINLSCEPGTLILGIGSDPTKDVINVRIPVAATVEGSANAMNFHNLRVETAVSFDARATLNIESQDGVDAALLNLSFFGGRIAGRDAQAGPALRIAGLTSQMHKFVAMDIVNQALLTGCADANQLIGCNISGQKTGVVVDVVPGAFNTLIRDNVITSSDGAVHVKGGSKVKILDNQIEQTGTNGHAQSAHLILEALSYDLRGIEVAGNNFGGGEASIQRAVAMLTATGKTIDGTMIGFNTWGVTASEDIKILDSRVKNTYLSPVQQLRGPRGGGGFTVYPAYTANTLDVSAMLNVVDSGTATRGVRKGATALGGASSTQLLASWTCSALTHFRMINDEVQFAGWADGPAAAQVDQIIGTLPVGFRPTETEVVPLVGFDLGTSALVAGSALILANGQIICNRPASTNAVRMGLSPIRFTAKREGYDPSY